MNQCNQSKDCLGDQEVRSNQEITAMANHGDSQSLSAFSIVMIVIVEHERISRSGAQTSDQIPILWFSANGSFAQGAPDTEIEGGFEGQSS
jgi:hypothetical protein